MEHLSRENSLLGLRPRPIPSVYSGPSATAEHPGVLIEQRHAEGGTLLSFGGTEHSLPPDPIEEFNRTSLSVLR